MMSFFAKSDMTGLRNLWLLFGGVHFCKFANRDCRIEAIVSQMEIKEILITAQSGVRGLSEEFRFGLMSSKFRSVL